MTKTLYQRLAYDGVADLLKLTRIYLQDDSCDYFRDMREQFKLVAAQDPRYMDHESVLALSVGGTNTKAMIAETRGGMLHVHHIKTVKSPAVLTHFYDFLDDILIKDEKMHRYLTESARPVMCIVLPVMMGLNNIPYHPEKIPTITGMLARNQAQLTEEFNVHNNLKRYFDSRGIKMPAVYCQPDPIIAHIGGVSQIDPVQDKRTMLLVCGTGLATSDDNTARFLSRPHVLDHDEGLYPADKTENYIYGASCSGFHLHQVMHRAIRIRQEEPDSALKGTDAWQYFQVSDDSVLVGKLWESTFNPDVQSPRLLQMRSALSKEAFAELQYIATMLMERANGSLANCIVATAIKINQREGFSPYHVIFEGSIAQNPCSLPVIFSSVYDRLRRDDVFEELGVQKPQIDLAYRPKKGVVFDASIPQDMQDKMEISLIGTAIAAITGDVLANG